MNRNNEPNPPTNNQPAPAPASTEKKLDDAKHFKRMAAGYATILDSARENRAHDGPVDADLLRESLDGLCEILDDAHRLTGNREPEMAEALEALERVKEDYREFL